MKRPADVELWVHPLARDSSFPRRLLCLFGDDELKRCRSLSLESDRLRFVMSRALLRHALSRTSGIPLEKWAFRLAPGGEWIIENPPATVCFSLSHAGNIVTVATSRWRIGLDIEPLEKSRWRPIAAVLSRHERQWLAKLPRTTRNTEELKLWTAKEAYAKLTGEGAEVDFSSVEIRPALGVDCHLWQEEVGFEGLPRLQVSLMGEGSSPAFSSVNTRRVRRAELAGEFL